MHPFVHAFTPAIDPPWQTRTDFAAFHAIARAFSELAATHLGDAHGPGGGAAAARHAGRAGHPARARCGTGGPARRPGAGPRLPEDRRRSSGTTAAVAEKMAALGPLLDTAGRHHQGHHLRARPGDRAACAAERHGARTAWPTGGRRWPATCTCARRSSRCPAPPTGGWPPRASPTLSRRTGTGFAGLAAEHEGKRITFADTQARPGAGDHLAGVVGQRDRRPPLLAVHHQRRAPQALAHPHRAAALLPRPRLDAEAGEALPVYRPPLNMARAVRRAGRSATAAASWAITRALPDPALQVVDPLRVPGQPAHARRCRAAARRSG